jgi:hypothetical protein
MAVIYLWSGATGSPEDGSSWSNAYTTIAGAIAAVGSAKTDYILMHYGHSETATAAHLDLGGMSSYPGVVVIRVDKDSSPQNAYHDARSNDSAGVNVNFNGSASHRLRWNEAITFYGAHFDTSGTAFLQCTNAADEPVLLIDCYIEAEQSALTLASTGSNAELYNCYLYRSSSGTDTNIFYQYETTRLMVTNCEFNVAANKMQGFVQQRLNSVAVVRNCDLTGISDTTTQLFDTDITLVGLVVFENCRLNSSLALPSTDTSLGLTTCKMIGCDTDAGKDIHRDEWRYPSGCIFTESTLVRTGGAAPDGTNEISWKMEVLPYCGWSYPLHSDWITRWAAADTYTITVYAYHNGEGSGTSNRLTTKEFGIEVEYLGASGNVARTRLTTMVRPDETATDWTNDTGSTWGGALSNKDKLTTASFTTARAGPLKMRFISALTSASGLDGTVYVDPKFDLTAT